MKSMFCALLLSLCGLPLQAETATAPLPVKVFVVSHTQDDHGTANYAEAVRDAIGKNTHYKLWTGAPKAFPKSGILIDIQGIDIRDGNDAAIGSAVITSVTVQSVKDPGYSRTLVENLLEIAPNGADVHEEATELLKEVDQRIPRPSQK